MTVAHFGAELGKRTEVVSCFLDSLLFTLSGALLSDIPPSF